jgi:hypothetical protein
VDCLLPHCLALDRERETGFAMQLEPVEPSAFLGGLIKIFIELLNSRTPGVPVAAANWSVRSG